ncbi:MAG: hypothetical protein J5545_12220 [Bacteroidaceae bacterium]|nr:hypothetical protein [Bacteroidaceae bacterium]
MKTPSGFVWRCDRQQGFLKGQASLWAERRYAPPLPVVFTPRLGLSFRGRRQSLGVSVLSFDRLRLSLVTLSLILPRCSARAEPLFRPHRTIVPPAPNNAGG